MKRFLSSITALMMALTMYSCNTSPMPDSSDNQPDDEIPEQKDTVSTETPEQKDTLEVTPPEEENPPVELEKLKISIIGDSYSTFEGWSNKDVAGNRNDFWVYYPEGDNGTDITTVDRTWWYMLCQKPEYELEVSNSYSSSVVSNTWYGAQDVAGTDLSFMNRVGKNSKGVDYNGNPDIILVFGGTNDCWAGVKMGDYVYENWTVDDLKCFRPALSKLFSSLQEMYPDAKIYNITNSGTGGAPGLTATIVESIKYVCKHHKIPNIVLKNIEKKDNHPTYKGMQAICEQVYAVLTGAVDPEPEPEGEPDVPGGVKLEGEKIEYTPLNKYFVEYKTGEAVAFDDPAWWVTDYVEIPADAGKLSVAPITIFDGGASGNQTCPVAFYDADKEYIKEGSFPPPGISAWAGNILDWEIPENSRYVRFCWADYLYTHVDTKEQVDLNGKITAVWVK